MNTLCEAVEPKVEIRSYVYLRNMVEEMVSQILEGLDAPPFVPEYNGRVHRDSDIMVFEHPGCRSRHHLGMIPPYIRDGGWPRVQSDVDNHRAFLAGNPKFNEIGCVLRYPFGFWSTYPSYDHYDWARCVPELERVCNLDEFSTWGEKPYDAYAYIGGASLIGGFNGREQHKVDMSNPAAVARKMVRNLMPYYTANMGLCIDSAGRWVNAENTPDIHGLKYQSDANNILYGIVRHMFGNRVGIETVPKADPYFNQQLWQNDGIQSSKSYYSNGVDVSHMSKDSRIFLWVSSRPTAMEIESECRRILQENIDDPDGPKRVPCLMYMTEARNQGINAANLHPETFEGNN